MSTPDPAISAAYERAFARLGVAVQVTFSRIVGVAPAATITSVTVMAVVRDYVPDTEAVARTDSSMNKLGAITQGDRSIIVMASDLAGASFPLPLKKNDKAVLVDTGEELNILAVDAMKRAAAGAIEVRASGVA